MKKIEKEKGKNKKREGQFYSNLIKAKQWQEMSKSDTQNNSNFYTILPETLIKDYALY